MKLVTFNNKLVKFGSAILRFVNKIDPNNITVLSVKDLTGKYSDSTGVSFCFKPASDFDADTITVYNGRNYSASNSNTNGSLDFLYIREYSAVEVDSTADSTIRSYATAALYGSASSDLSNPGLFTDTEGGSSTDNGNNADASTKVGLHKVYMTNSIEVDGVTLYEYTTSMADSSSRMHFSKDKYYTIGFYNFYNGNATQASTVVLNYDADENNCLVKHSYNDSKITAKYTSTKLPYFKVNGEVFTNFEFAKPVPSSDIVFTNGDFSITDFSSLSTVLSEIQTGDKLALFVRHAERGSATGKAGGLTTDGIEQAKNLGNALKTVCNTNDFYGEATDVLRTLQSVYWASYERGDTLYSEPSYDSATSTITTNITKSEVYKGTAYTSITDWNSLSNWCADSANKTLITTVSQAILRHIVSNSTKSLNMFCSHDTVLVPMITYITNWNLIPTSSNWCNYLNGIAIILRANGTIVIAPLDALNL